MPVPGLERGALRRAFASAVHEALASARPRPFRISLALAPNHNPMPGPQVVLDEADTMFDRGFGPEVRAVLGPLRSKAAPARVVLVCATMTPVRRPAARPRSGPVA